jgi:hypothetical protein
MECALARQVIDPWGTVIAECVRAPPWQAGFHTHALG